jgi:hypothetical protein
MKIYIGSFKDMSRYRKNYTPIAISSGVPGWYTGKRYKKLAPPYDLMINYRHVNDCDEEDEIGYIKEYCQSVLSYLNPKDVYVDLEKLSDGKDVVLITQESSQEFSHRILVCAWLNNAGIECEEII